MLNTQGKFYLGRLFDPEQGKPGHAPLLYDPADLTTHALVVGMTGSGKTGLCIGLLEEAALQGIPAIVIDPKGDLTNLLLHFPNLAPDDFRPWLDADAVRREGKSLEAAAQETAERWRKGLAEWGIDRARILALQQAAEFAVYTPGSNAGLPVSVFSSLVAPAIPWAENREVLRERIASTVTALLGLVGMDEVDPLRSREHILLSNIFESHWSQGQDLTLETLIHQVQQPPFDKLGAFPLENLFPEKDRFQLAMLLNNILAAPGFEVWREGTPLDIPSLLFSSEGRPRHTVFYIAHLNDPERMFFVTLLLGALETWMRTQPGATTLRALLYMDEIFGYLPPTANPPSKPPLLRLLKQARAFGLGVLLATQNPVDVDYKAMSNAGTWFIGKLQTDRDKQRLLDGLESAAGTVSRATFDKLIASLGKRIFIMHNVHQKGPVVFQTRFVMNYLAGPLTRAQIPALNALVGAERPAATPPPSGPAASSLGLEPVMPSPAVPSPAARPPRPTSRPPLPSAIAEYFLPLIYSLPEALRAGGLSLSDDTRQIGLLYRPALLAAAQVRLFDRKYGIDVEVARLALIPHLTPHASQRWEDFLISLPIDNLSSSPLPDARFETPPAVLTDPKRMTALQKDFLDWVYRSTSLKVRANEALKVYAGPDVSQAEFIKACAEAARQARDREIEKETARFDRQIAALQEKLEREERELQQDQAELQSRKLEAGANLLELGAGLFGLSRKKSLSTQLTKQRIIANAKADVEESLQTIAQFKKQLAELQAERARLVERLNQHWGDIVNKITEIPLTPKKTDIHLIRFGIAWAPYYLVETGGREIEVPAFGVAHKGPA